MAYPTRPNLLLCECGDVRLVKRGKLEVSKKGGGRAEQESKRHDSVGAKITASRYGECMSKAQPINTPRIVACGLDWRLRYWRPLPGSSAVSEIHADFDMNSDRVEKNCVLLIFGINITWQLGKASCCVPFQLNWVEMSPPADIGLFCSDEELIIILDRIITGSPLPGNVIRDVNPYHYKPANLPDNIWFFIHSKEKKDTHFGCWRTKGEACNLFSNSSITGWRSTLEFYEGQAPYEHKTGWVMQEYWITQNRLSEDNKAKEASSLCKVFLVGKQTKNHEKHQEAASGDMASHSTISLVQNAENDIGQSSSSRHQVIKDRQTGNLALEEIFPDYPEENVPEIDCLSRGDYLELLDLDNPASPSSSSDSSCLTMSSDECFDSLALQDLETENNNDMVQNDAGCKFSVSASIKPTEVLMHPASSGAVYKSSDVQVIGTDKSIPSSALRIRILDKNTLKSSSRSQKPDFRSEGTSSDSGKAAMPFSTHMAASEEERKASISRRKKPKKKYFCFMPF
ncbi:hypothetical protein FNV43_RR11457 [Rhamnella rubrinervis]|uniref:NAC domain-containing protein n=1 Tax=Rhamnella rubrinervis TaxID=2594499 RepID=A0A8K0H6F0_9ROSA|nr:hypothetical protein FNV43_RR11457 [Rhamnella rubrinervis]